MKTAAIATTLVTILPSVTFGASVIVKRQQPTAADLEAAVQAWHDDTQTVSNFLDSAAFFLDDNEFKAAAQNALNAENDELTHKLVLDDFLAPFNVPNIITANTTLVNDGTFQLVVDKLGDMATNGQAVLGDVNDINNDRCTRVLPAIDAYFQEIAASIDDGTTISIPTEAVRPSACEAICAENSCSL